MWQMRSQLWPCCSHEQLKGLDVAAQITTADRFLKRMLVLPGIVNVNIEASLV